MQFCSPLDMLPM